MAFAVSQFGHTNAGIALTTRQVARGESETNLANRFLLKFAKKEFWLVHLGEIKTKIDLVHPTHSYYT